MMNLKSLLNFFLLILAIMAILGGTAYLIYYRQYIFGVANLALAYLAWPSLKEIIKDLKG